jgi:hypothetical protein
MVSSPHSARPPPNIFRGRSTLGQHRARRAIDTLQPGRGNDATRKGSSFYSELRAAVTVIGGATLASVILPKCFAASMYRYCM